MLTGALEALGDWQVAQLFRRSAYAYPLLNAAHIFSLALLVGSILPADLRILGLFRELPPGPFLRRMTGIAAFGLALAIATGFLLFSVKPLDYAGNPAFLTKISLVAIGAALALSLRFSPAWRAVLAGQPAGAGLKAVATASLAIWVCALLAGRWIAFL